MDANYLGRVGYSLGLNMQTDARMRVGQAPNKVIVLGCEHEPVVTLGRRALSHEDLIWPEVDIRKQGVEIVQVDRGGRATFHGPGQLVVYPILHLPTWSLGVRQWMETLRDVGIELLKDMANQAGLKDPAFHWLDEAPGFYVQQGGRLFKVGSVGLRISKGISFHGLTFSNHEDLSWRQMLRACGQSSDNLGLVTLKELGIFVTHEELFQAFCTRLGRRLTDDRN